MFYYVTFKGRRAELYTETKQIVRQFNVPSEIVNAQVQGSGDNVVVALTLQNGKTYVYDKNGTILRR